MDSSSSSTFGSAHNLGQCAHSPRFKKKNHSIPNFKCMLHSFRVLFDRNVFGTSLSGISFLYSNSICERHLRNKPHQLSIHKTDPQWLMVSCHCELVWRQTRLTSNVHRRHINQMFDQDHFKRGQTVRMQHQAWLRKSVAYRILAKKSFSELFKWRIYGD